MWVDALSRFSKSSVKWHLWPKTFCFLMTRFGCLDTDLFAAPSSHLLLLHRTWFTETEVRDLDAFMANWNRW